MKILIPDTTQIAGFEIEILVNSSLAEKEKRLGKCDYRNNVIQLACHSKVIFDRMIMEQTYLHEITHYILHCMGEHELRDNERFVEGYSHLLYQALTQGRGGEDEEEEGTPM